MTLMLNKILPFFVLPFGFGLLLIAAGLLLRRRLLSLVGLGAIWLFATPLVGNALLATIEGEPGRIPLEQVTEAEAVVVLSGMLKEVPNARLGEWGGAVDRFEAGVELWQAGKAPLLFFTGGWVPWRPDARPEGEVLAERARRLVPATAIRVTGKVGNTAAEAPAVRDLLLAERAGETPDPSAPPRIVLVTSAFHMPRAARLFEQAGLEVQRYPVDFALGAATRLTPIDLLPSLGALSRSERALREWLGMLYYHLREQGVRSSKIGTAPY